MDDKEILIRQTVLLEGIIKKTDEIEKRVTTLTDTHVMETKSKLAVLEEKTQRLERIIYGAIAIIFAQAIGLVFLWLKKG